MKLKGKRPGVHIEPIILPRPDGDLVFHCKAIENFDDFESLCPPPEPPAVIKPNGEKIHNAADPDYIKQLSNYGDKRVAYMVVKGLSDATVDLEWETVKMDDSNTWIQFRDEFRESGLSDVEINRVVSGAMIANSLSEFAVEAARKRFLAGEQDQESE